MLSVTRMQPGLHSPGQSSMETPEQTQREMILVLPSDPFYLRPLRSSVLSLFQLAGVEEQPARMAALAVEEAWTNIYRHTYEGRCDCPIRIEARLLVDRIELTLIDYGRRCKEETFLPQMRDPLKPGGLGLQLIHQVFDDVRYDGSADGENRLCLVKRIP